MGARRQILFVSALIGAAALTGSALAGEGGTSSIFASGLVLSGPPDRASAYVQAAALIDRRRFQGPLGALGDVQRLFGPRPAVLGSAGLARGSLGPADVAAIYYRPALALLPSQRGAVDVAGEAALGAVQFDATRRLLAKLDRQCAFGCIETESLKRWIAERSAPEF